MQAFTEECLITATTTYCYRPIDVFAGYAVDATIVIVTIVFVWYVIKKQPR